MLNVIWLWSVGGRGGRQKPNKYAEFSKYFILISAGIAPPPSPPAAVVVAAATVVSFIIFLIGKKRVGEKQNVWHTLTSLWLPCSACAAAHKQQQNANVLQQQLKSMLQKIWMQTWLDMKRACVWTYLYVQHVGCCCCYCCNCLFCSSNAI